MKNPRIVHPFLLAAIVQLTGIATEVRGQADQMPGGDRQTFGVGGPPAALVAEVDLPAKIFAKLPSVRNQMALNNVDEVRLGDIDLAAALANAPACDGKCMRVGVGRPLNLTAEQGQWRNAGEGIAGGGVQQPQLWVMDVVSDGARAVRLHLTHMNLPDGAELYMYAPHRPDAMEGPYTGAGPLDTGEFWTGAFEGDRVRIEYLAPAGKPVEPFDTRPFIIDQAQHIYEDLIGGNEDEGGIAGAGCHNDVTCYGAPWSSVKQSVARITFVDGGSSYLCTGQLLNSFAGDLTPYFLTANHCIGTGVVANTTQFYWKYQTSVCNGAPPSLSDVPKSNIATLLSTDSAQDFTLLMVDGALPCGMWWNGWLANVIANGSDVACIHHPNGSNKRISFGEKAVAAAGCSTGDPNFIRINWTDGITLAGSSGSAVYLSSTQQVIGQLYCGPSSCENLNSYDIYGAFRETYNDHPSVQAYLDGGSDDNLEPNDTCPAAALVTEGTYTLRTVKGNDDDWYRATVPGGGGLSVTLSFTSTSGDIDLLLYDACGGAVVDSSTGIGGFEGVGVFNPNAGSNTYYFRVYLADCDTRATYTMTVSASLSNDFCSNAREIGGTTLAYNPAPYSTTLADASMAEPQESCEVGGVGVSNSVWYEFTPCATGLIGVNTIGSSYDTVLSIFSGTCGIYAQVACNDDIGGGDLDSFLNNIAVTAGTHYIIKISDYDTTADGGTLDFNFQYGPNAPSNDSCATPVVIGSGVLIYGPVPYCTAGADTAGIEPQESCGSPPNSNSVFYTYTPVSSGRATIDTFGSDYDTVLSVFTGSCAFESQVACNDDTGGLQSQLLGVGMTGGTLYRIKVADYSSPGGGTLDFNLRFKRCLADIEPAPNGNFVVDTEDLLAVISGWGSCPPPCLPPCAADVAPLSGDCLVNVQDLLEVIGAWGNCP